MDEDASRLGRFIQQALNERDVDDLREDLDACITTVVGKICESLPGVDRDVVLAVWQTGIQELGDMIEGGLV
jgi:hypothetical protein